MYECVCHLQDVVVYQYNTYAIAHSIASIMITVGVMRDIVLDQTLCTASMHLHSIELSPHWNAGVTNQIQRISMTAG